MTYSTNKDFNQYIKTLIKQNLCQYQAKGGRKHASLIYADGAKQIIPSSPSNCPRALHNFKKQSQNIIKGQQK